jgi:hypothetical protein
VATRSPHFQRRRRPIARDAGDGQLPEVAARLADIAVELSNA